MAGVGRKSLRARVTNFPVWCGRNGENLRRIGLFSMLTGAGRTNKMLIVPPREAAHFVSAAQIDAAQRGLQP